MSRTTDGTLLPDDDFHRLQELADRFADARRNGSVDDWEPYLAPPGDPLRRAVLLELIKIDMEMTWRHEGRALVETYEVLYPELAPPPVDLIVEEYRIRHRHGDQPPLEEYQARFPDLYAQIEERARQRPPQESAPRFQAPPTPEATAEPTRLPPTSSGPAASQHAMASLFPEGYRPIEMIGRGNFGEVWRAEAPGGIAVAVKIVSQPLDHDAAQRELKALELVKKFQHPALLSTLAFFAIQNRLVIVMELADGTLRDRLKQCQAKGLPGIPAEELLSYFRDAAVGLDWLHWQGTLHRDIKPENILLKHGYAKVADFGLAREHIGTMMSVSFAGTPAFMAPEVWGGKANERSDQYSLAFTYAELRLGRRPLEGGDFLQVMHSAQEGVPDLTGLPETEQDVLRRALAKRPEDRFENCVEFVEALEHALSPNGRTSRRRPSPMLPRPTASSDDGTSTAQTKLQTGVPAKPRDPSERTIDVDATAPKTPIVWKPPGPTPKSGGSAKAMLVAIAAVILLSGAVAALFLLNNDTPTVTSSPEPMTSKPQPPPTTANVIKPEVPPRFIAAPDAALVTIRGKKYPEQIVFSAGQPAEMVLRLLQPEGGEPFYTAVNKATNALVEAYRSEMPGAMEKWRGGEARLPAMNLTWDEARRIAEWMGGQLPTPAQLDHAAGFPPREGRTGPARGPRVAVKLTQPLPVDREHDDISPMGIRDLSGNGREWTRQKVTINGEEFAILRGRMYTLATPLSYEHLAREQDERNAQVQRVGIASPQTGFRVVVELK